MRGHYSEPHFWVRKPWSRGLRETSTVSQQVVAEGADGALDHSSSLPDTPAHSPGLREEMVAVPTHVWALGPPDAIGRATTHLRTGGLAGEEVEWKLRLGTHSSETKGFSLAGQYQTVSPLQYR